MQKKAKIANNIDEYIADFPKDVQQKLQQLRATIKKAAPAAAEEAIKYAIPAFVYKGNLVFFGGYKNHIGFYAAPTGHEAFKKELSVYKSGKGSVQFPLDEPLPLKLVRQIVKFRAIQNAEEAKEKLNKKKK